MVSERELRMQLGFKEQILYHYCSLEALYSIISSRSFWLTSLDSTNDKKELKYGDKILNDVLKKMICEETNIDMKKILEDISAAPADSKYKKHRNNYHYYGASFVENKDSLTHWERYGNDGYGVCIAFNIWMIQHFFETWSLPNICTSWLWHKEIIYKESCNYSVIPSVRIIRKFLARGNRKISFTGFCRSLWQSSLPRPWVHPTWVQLAAR